MDLCRLCTNKQGWDPSIDIRPLRTKLDSSVRRASLALRLMIALPSPLGFGFFAFGAFEKFLKKHGNRNQFKLLRTMIERIIGGDLASVAVRPARTSGQCSQPFILLSYSRYITSQLASTVILRHLLILAVFFVNANHLQARRNSRNGSRYMR
jgi:hypothetical protein